ncbi:hypothetical protein LDENG_00104850, partial [Lucifuga dentata]
MGFMDVLPGRSHSFQERILPLDYNFQKSTLKPEAFWRSILLSDESKIELFGRNENHYVWRKANTAFLKKNLVPTVKLGGGSILVWACFAAGGPGNLTVIDGLMNSSVYQSILDEHVKASARKLQLGTKWILQQDNDPKHSSKST